MEEEVMEKVEGLQEFLIEKLITFERRLEDVENLYKDSVERIKEMEEDFSLKDSSEDKKPAQEMEKKMQEIKNEADTHSNDISMLRQSIEEMKQEMLPVCQSTPKGDLRKPRNPFDVGLPSPPSNFSIPEGLKDVADVELRQKLQKAETQVKFAKHSEKLTYCQLVFIHYWLEENMEKVSGRSEQVLRLIKDGEQAKMWNKGFKPPGSKLEFFSYLQEKLKNMAKRRRVSSYKESCTGLYNVIMGGEGKSST